MLDERTNEVFEVYFAKHSHKKLFKFPYFLVTHILYFLKMVFFSPERFFLTMPC